MEQIKKYKFKVTEVITRTYTIETEGTDFYEAESRAQDTFDLYSDELKTELAITTESYADFNEYRN